MEWKKILTNRKSIIGLVIILAVQLIFFAYLKNRESLDDITDYVYDTENEKQSEYKYIEQYHGSIEAIVNQAGTMSSISIFNKQDSFATRNIEKTKDDFEKMMSVYPVYFEGSFLKDFFEYDFLNAFVVISGLVIAFTLAREKKQGLMCMTFSTKNGRMKLVAEKIEALLIWDIFITVVFYTLTLLESMIISNGSIFECLQYPIQSLSMFSNLPMTVNIGEFLIIYILYRFIVLFVIMLIALVLMETFRHIILSVGILGLTGIVSYVLCNLSGDTTTINMFKYCNLYYLMSGMGFFTEYKNIDIFNQAINKNAIIIALGMAVVFLAGIIAFVIGCKKYPCSSGKRFKIKSYLFQKKLDSLKESCLKIFWTTGAEYHKVLWTQKGILVIVILFIFMFNQTDYTEIVNTKYQDLYYDFMDKYEGEISSEALQAINDLETEIKEAEDKYTEVSERYENGETDLEEYMYASMQFNTYASERIFLQKIKEQTEYIEELKSEGIDAWYVNEYCFNHIFMGNNSLLNVCTLMSIVLTLSGIFYYERKNGMTQIMRQSINGRNWLFKRKLVIGIVIAAIITIAEIIFEISANIHVYGLGELKAPVQSIKDLSFVNIKCSVGVFIFLMYLFRIVIVMSVSIITTMISTVVSQKITIGIAMAICIPSVLTMVGIDIMEKISVVDILSVSAFMIRYESVMSVFVALIIFVAADIITLRIGYKHWCLT